MHPPTTVRHDCRRPCAVRTEQQRWDLIPSVAAKQTKERTQNLRRGSRPKTQHQQRQLADEATTKENTFVPAAALSAASTLLFSPARQGSNTYFASLSMLFIYFTLDPLTSPDMRASFSNSRVNDVKVSVSNRAKTTSTAGVGCFRGEEEVSPPPPFTPPPAAASASASASASAAVPCCWAIRAAFSAALHLTLAVFLKCV